MSRKHIHRFAFIMIIIAILSLAAALILFALRQNMNLFFTPSQVFNQEAPNHTRIRVGGMVEKDSLVRGENLEVSFKITDFTKTLNIRYRGILPDLFREGQGIVAQGKLISEGVFLADEVLAKHDENYMPPEISHLKAENLKAEGRVEP